MTKISQVADQKIQSRKAAARRHIIILAKKISKYSIT
jgi:hypothetical protein